MSAKLFGLGFIMSLGLLSAACGGEDEARKGSQTCPVGTWGANCVPCLDGTWDHDSDSNTQCIPWSVCEGEETGGSRQSDVTCVQTTSCSEGSFRLDGLCYAWKDCAAGEYVLASGTPTSDRMCAECGEGTYSAVPNSAMCVPDGECAPGTRLNTDGQCDLCESGTYCAGGVEPLQPCDQGTWDHDGNPGTVCESHTSCAPGTFVAVAGSATADQQCSACPEGTNTEQPNLSMCVADNACAPGTRQISPATDTTPAVCEECEVGTYCAGGESSSVPCTAGTWDHDADAATVCVAHSNCSPGQKQVTEGTSTSNRVCLACDVGTYSVGTNAATCNPWKTCPAGEYVSTAGSVTTDRICTLCPSGTFSDQENVSMCVAVGQCAPGTVQTSPATSEAPATCEACQVGTYCAGGTATSVVCAAGTWDHDNNPATACIAHSNCAPGQKVLVQGTATSERSCGACESGTYSNTTNATICMAWQVCAPGQFISSPGSSTADQACATCPNGTYSTQPNVTMCIAQGQCAPGTVQTSPATPEAPAVCSTCAAGTYCAGGTTPSVACASGTWDHDNNAATACVNHTVCAPGQQVVSAGTAVTDRTCGSCPTGTYSGVSNATSCQTWTQCSSGEYVTQTGTHSRDQTCGTCAAGRYSATANATSCELWTVCTQGEYVLSQGSRTADRVCSGCASGTYSVATNSSSCQAWSSCSAGQYVSTSGTPANDRVCTSCSAGTFSSSANASSCQAWSTCSAGEYVVAQGSLTQNRSCSDCSTGTYSTQNNATSCQAWTQCAPGQYVTQTGSSFENQACGTCASGTYSATTNAQACVPWSTCEPGQFVAASGTSSTNRSCNVCAAGRYSSTQNASACIEWSTCSPGEYVASAGTSSSNQACSVCAAGTYSTTNNQASCSAWSVCPDDTILTANGTSTTDQTCEACQPGDYSVGPNARVCLEYPAMEFLQVAAGVNRVCGIRTDNRPVCWGTNTKGIAQAVNETEDAWDKISVARDWRLCGIRSSDKAIQCFSENSPDPSGVPPSGAYRSVAVAGIAGCAIRSSGNEVVCWGMTTRLTFVPSVPFPSYSGQLDQISINGNTGCGIKTSDQTVDCWGSDHAGLVSNKPFGTFDSVNIGSSIACAIRSSDKSLYCWGASGGMTGVPPGAFEQVTTSSQGACGLRSSDKRIVCWGQTSLPSVIEPEIAFASLNINTDGTLCAIREIDNAVMCWGHDTQGMISGRPSNHARFSQIDTGWSQSCGIDLYTDEYICWDRSLRPIPGVMREAAVGEFFGCGIRDSDSLPVCWGVTRPSNSPIVAPQIPLDSIDAGANHACGIRSSDKHPVCWGGTQGSVMPLPEPVSQVVAGEYHTCAIRDSDGTVACWGIATPPPSGAFTSLSLGGTMCGIRPNGQLECWGSQYPSLNITPPGVFSQVAVGSHHICAMYAGDSSVVCWSNTDWINAPSFGYSFVELGEPFVSISSAGNLTCGLRADGTTRCWGSMVWNPR